MRFVVRAGAPSTVQRQVLSLAAHLGIPRSTLPSSHRVSRFWFFSACAFSASRFGCCTDCWAADMIFTKFPAPYNRSASLGGFTSRASQPPGLASPVGALPSRGCPFLRVVALARPTPPAAPVIPPAAGGFLASSPARARVASSLDLRAGSLQPDSRSHGPNKALQRTALCAPCLLLPFSSLSLSLEALGRYAHPPHEPFRRTSEAG